MANELQRDYSGEFQSPGGFVFGVQGWNWGEQQPTSITFFTNGTVRVADQHGRPIRGTVKNGKPVYFDRCTHAQAVAALAEERIDWRTLNCAGWPQLPYEQLKELGQLPTGIFAGYGSDGNIERLHYPPTPISELRKIRDPALRKDALRLRREVDAEKEKELSAANEVDAEKEKELSAANDEDITE